MATSRNGEKQNVTVSLSRQVLKKAKILAARVISPNRYIYSVSFGQWRERPHGLAGNDQ